MELRMSKGTGGNARESAVRLHGDVGPGNPDVAADRHDLGEVEVLGILVAADEDLVK